jgi:hypothetical protein
VNSNSPSLKPELGFAELSTVPIEATVLLDCRQRHRIVTGSARLFSARIPRFSIESVNGRFVRSFVLTVVGAEVQAERGRVSIAFKQIRATTAECAANDDGFANAD